MPIEYALSDKYKWILNNQAKPPLSIHDVIENRHKELLGAHFEKAQKNYFSTLPSPFTLNDIDKATNRVLKAIEKDEKIVIFGDYDVDGTCSSSLFRRFFKDIGIKIEIYIPCRINEGYGLNRKSLEALKDLNANLIITVDNGTSSIDACLYAKELGIDVIITDHHNPQNILPDAFAIINPKLPNCDFPMKDLSGVGVAFYFIIALRTKIRDIMPERKLPNLKNYLDYVAIGSIADMVPLTGINHILCKVGLDVLNTHLKNKDRLGLYYLLKELNWTDDCPLNTEDISFKIAPHINAAGRLKSAKFSEMLLSTNDENEAKELAIKLRKENKERQDMQKKFTQEAIDELSSLKKIPKAIVLYKPTWHIGIVGLVASKLVEKFSRPSIILGSNNNEIKGSGRSFGNFNLFDALKEHSKEFISFGGHSAAIGLSLEEKKIPYLKSIVEKSITEHAQNEELMQSLLIDSKVKVNDLDMLSLKKISEIEPFGMNNPKLKWLIQNVKIDSFKRIGRVTPQTHARILVKDDEENSLWATAFHVADKLEKIYLNNAKIDMVIEAQISYWKGQEKEDIKIIDVVVK